MKRKRKEKGQAHCVYRRRVGSGGGFSKILSTVCIKAIVDFRNTRIVSTKPSSSSNYVKLS